MDVKLNAFQFESKNLSIESQDVHAKFEYQKMNNDEVKIYMNTFIGGDHQNCCRFQLNLEYIVRLNQSYDDDQQMIQDVLENIIPTYGELISVLDAIITRERH